MTLKNQSTVLPRPNRCSEVCTSASSRRRRERHDIIVEILQMSRDKARRTKMMEKIGMSFSQINTYLNELKEADFISEDAGNWKTTEKGLLVIDACKLCFALVNQQATRPTKPERNIPT